MSNILFKNWTQTWSVHQSRNREFKHLSFRVHFDVRRIMFLRCKSSNYVLYLIRIRTIVSSQSRTKYFVVESRSWTALYSICYSIVFNQKSKIEFVLEKSNTTRVSQWSLKFCNINLYVSEWLVIKTRTYKRRLILKDNRNSIQILKRIEMT